MKAVVSSFAFMLATLCSSLLSCHIRSGQAEAATLHFWCVPNQPPEYTWKHEIIRPPVTQLFIDRDAKTLRYENTWGVQQFKDGATHDTDDPHVGLVDRVEFYGQFVRGYQQQIVAPGYATMHNYGDRTDVTFDFQQRGILRSIPRMGGTQDFYTDYCVTTPPSK